MSQTGGPAEVSGARTGAVRVSWPVRHLPGRVWRGRPLRLIARALVAGQPAAPALVTGVITWFLLTARADLAPPPER